MKMYATTDICSYNRTLYAAQNTPLTVIRTSGAVAIVETAQGFKFPCPVEMLSENEVVVVVDKPIESQLMLF